MSEFGVSSCLLDLNRAPSATEGPKGGGPTPGRGASAGESFKSGRRRAGSRPGAFGGKVLSARWLGPTDTAILPVT